MSSSGLPVCLRPGAARSCDASSRRSRPTRSATWATPPPSPTRVWSRTWWPTARTSPRPACRAGESRAAPRDSKEGAASRPPLLLSLAAQRRQQIPSVFLFDDENVFESPPQPILLHLLGLPDPLFVTLDGKLFAVQVLLQHDSDL